jgi:hypothetical protein
MHELEDSVAPFLGSMLLHECGAALDAEQQRDLARWEVMKVLLLELCLRQQHPRRRPLHGYAPSEAELAWLYGNNEPPPRCRVWLGAFDGQNTLVAWTQAKLFQETLPNSGILLKSHLTTMTIGQVKFQVFSIDFVTADQHAMPAFEGNPPEPFAQALTRIWPIERPTVRWPPPYYITEDVLDRVAGWQVGV